MRRGPELTLIRASGAPIRTMARVARSPVECDPRDTMSTPERGSEHPADEQDDRPGGAGDAASAPDESVTAQLEEPTPEPSGDSAPQGPPARPPLARRSEGRWLAGVASGLAAHLDWPVGVVRLGFIALTLVHFLGVAVYALLWVVLPGARGPREAPGLEAARRTGMRPGTKQGWTRDAAPAIALTVLAVGLVWLTTSMGWGLSSTILWPAVFAMAGIALVWRQADLAEDEDEEDPNIASWLRPLVRTGGWLGVTRLVTGLGLVALGVALVAASQIGADRLPAVLGLSLLLVVGTLIAAAPWMYRWRRSLSRAREEKLVADARADMAAHLHDSVLQSLALIQRQAGDPRAVTAIARRQERELRQWLYGEQSTAPESVQAALLADAAGIEAERGAPIEVVAVGDAPLTDSTEALVAAAREAMVNAAKHSGADKIDVFLEVDEGEIEVFVRDRGVGFDLDHIDADRLGVRRSIIARMERHGGRARIRSAPGEGTEIRLTMDLAERGA